MCFCVSISLSRGSNGNSSQSSLGGYVCSLASRVFRALLPARKEEGLFFRGYFYFHQVFRVLYNRIYRVQSFGFVGYSALRGLSRFFSYDNGRYKIRQSTSVWQSRSSSSNYLRLFENFHGYLHGTYSRSLTKAIMIYGACVYGIYGRFLSLLYLRSRGYYRTSLAYQGYLLRGSSSFSRNDGDVLRFRTTYDFGDTMLTGTWSYDCVQIGSRLLCRLLRNGTNNSRYDLYVFDRIGPIVFFGTGYFRVRVRPLANEIRGVLYYVMFFVGVFSRSNLLYALTQGSGYYFSRLLFLRGGAIFLCDLFYLSSRSYRRLLANQCVLCRAYSLSERGTSNFCVTVGGDLPRTAGYRRFRFFGKYTYYFFLRVFLYREISWNASQVAYNATNCSYISVSNFRGRLFMVLVCIAFLYYRGSNSRLRNFYARRGNYYSPAAIYGSAYYGCQSLCYVRSLQCRHRDNYLASVSTKLNSLYRRYVYTATLRSSYGDCEYGGQSRLCSNDFPYFRMFFQTSNANYCCLSSFFCCSLYGLVNA